MKKNRFYLLAALATTAFSLSSCIYDDEVATFASNSEFSQDELKITASLVGTEAASRAASNLQSRNLEDWTNAGIFVYKTGETTGVSAGTNTTAYAGYANIAVNGTVPTTVSNPPHTTNITLTPTSPLFFPVDNTNVDAYVYAPYGSYSNVKAMEFTVAADQSKDEDYIASDFIYGKATATYSTKTANVTMYHALTKLTFKITESGANAAGISDITLNDISKKATINMSLAPNTSAPWLEAELIGTTTAGKHVNTSVTSTDISTVKVSNSSDNNNLYNDVKTGDGVSVIIPPQFNMSATAGPSVTVTIDNITRTAYLGSATFTAFQPGYEYIYTLNIKASGIVVVVVSIVPWEGGAAQDRDLTF